MFRRLADVACFLQTPPRVYVCRVSSHADWRQVPRFFYGPSQIIVDQRTRRQKQRLESMDRKSASSKRRMQLVAILGAAEDDDDAGGFGDGDHDWNAYRRINKASASSGAAGGDSDSENEQERVELPYLESLLAEFDPSSVVKPSNESAALTAADFQIQLGAEQIRIPELLFQPSLIGSDSAGLTACIARLLGKFEPVVAAALVRNVFVTGGHTAMPGFGPRLTQELESIQPCGTPVKVYSARCGRGWDLAKGCGIARVVTCHFDGGGDGGGVMCFVWQQPPFGRVAGRSLVCHAAPFRRSLLNATGL
jgi:actin-related protein 5